MIKIIVILSVALILSSCGMSNDEIIEERNKCASANMTAHFYQGQWSKDIIKIICMPKEIGKANER